ncbi:MAG: hypothetical protein HY445_01425 [Candidatus Niyogibacteria bacterium]|nr:hypothetical protein [Candidatus Niyogibacteria bacterium]
MSDLITATKTVLRERNYLALFLLLFPVIFFVFILIPVVAIPGNDFVFQLSIFAPKDYALLTILAPLVSLVITMNIFIFRRNKSIKDNLKSAGVGAAGSYSGIIATVFATASCSSCVAVLFGFLGTGAVFFAVENRWLFVTLAIGLMLVSLYFSAKKINKVCVSC